MDLWQCVENYTKEEKVDGDAVSCLNIQLQLFKSRIDSIFHELRLFGNVNVKVQVFK